MNVTKDENFKMKRTLYVTDMDGTLLDDNSRVSPESAEIITDLTRRGALITVATARTPATVNPLLAHTVTSLPAIVMTGATLWDRNTMRYIDTRFISPETSRLIRAAADRHGVNPFIYTFDDKGILTVYHNGERSIHDDKFINERMNLPLKRFHIDEPAGMNQSIPNTVLFFAMGPCQRINALADDLRRSIDCSVSNYVDIFGKDVGIIEIFAPEVSKANAVKRLARDINADRIVVFGDNLNDLPMMRIADLSVAVDNALPEVKNAASTVIGPNTSHSVARFIAEDFERMQ